MPIRKCPNCGLPVANLNVCPMCGASLSGNAAEKPQKEVAEKEESGVKSVIHLGSYRLSVWDFIFITICNLSIILIIINVIVGGVVWCHYPVFTLFSVYFLAFACAAKSVRRFIVRYRNAVVILNLLYGLFGFIFRMSTEISFSWTYDYFIPCNLICANIVLLSMCFVKAVPIRNILFSVVLILPQSILQFIFMLTDLTAIGRVPQILASIAFAINILTVGNLVFLYFIKYKNTIEDRLRLWE